MEYKESAVGCQPTCGSPPPEMACSLPYDGCVCKTGYLLSGDKCVRESECGCLTPLGIYMQIGDPKVQDCSGSYECIDDNSKPSLRYTPGGSACVTSAECVKSNGKFKCQCPDGFSGDGITSCDDIDECLLNIDTCSTETSECVNMPGSYICECLNGFEMVEDTCEDINECERNVDNCFALSAECINIPGSFRCECFDGYKMVDSKCEAPTDEPFKIPVDDENECLTGQNNCSVNADCTDETPGFSCSCKIGFSGNGTDCQDINECLTGQHNCSEKADCNNQSPEFSCVCKPGYSGNGEVCDDINECMYGNTCPASSNCLNSPQGSYTCQCLEGYTMVNDQCEDINECLTGQHNCSVNADCSNGSPGFSCVCKPGYSGNGEVCDDINECLTGQHNCSVNADCSNGSPGFSCVCKSGYSGNGEVCDDINECTDGTYKCPASSSCVNSPPGNYSCKCNDGYTMEANECKLVCGKRKCDVNASCKRNRCICNKGFYGIGHIKCSDTCGGHECVRFSKCRYNKCKCNRGFYGDATVKCKRLCGRPKRKCHENATCKRNKCVCDKGYIGDGFKCHKPCTCSASGHVHYRTFDGSMIYYPGNCSYLLSQHNDSKDASCNYRIIIDNEAGPPGEPVMIKSVSFNISGQTVFLKGNDVFVDGLHMELPYSSMTGAIRISRSGAYTRVETDCHVRLQWSGKASLLVEIPVVYSPSLNGLCGNCNDQEDDYRTQNGVDVSALADRDNAIGSSYALSTLVGDEQKA
ncbi:fibrillin-1-like [Ylistrum balloti]|uniref:fibrillin-1-like n=1 Tax=Ylistrum balloti TaxID=509963 RepID=UPI002905DA6C|nr:fibrillin-1-like [Ylistrum balloti]